MNAGKSGRYVRKLSAMERYSLVIHEAYRYHVDGVVEGTGKIDPVALQAAVAQAAVANPGVRVRLKGFLGFCRWVDSGVAPKVHVIDGSEWDGTSEHGMQFMELRLDALKGGPVADVLLVNCADQRTRLVFRGLHAAMDGRGMLHWITDVFRVLRGEPALGSDSTLTDLDVQEQYKSQVPVEEPPAAPAMCLPVVEPTEQADKALSYVWRRVELDRNVSNLLTKTGVFLGDWVRRRAAGDIGFTIPVDYRGLRTEEMGVGNLTGYLRLSVNEADTPRTLMQQLNQRIRAFADCRQFPGIRVVLWIPISYMVRKLVEKLDTVLYTVTKDLPTGGIVSMGMLKQEWFCCPGFRADMTYAIPGAVGKLNVVFVNYPTFTVVTFAAPARYNHSGQLDEMIAAYQAHFST